MLDLPNIVDSIKKAIKNSENLQQLDDVRVKCLGKNGELTKILKNLGTLPKVERPKVGDAVNKAKKEIQKFLNERRDCFNNKELQSKLDAQSIDVTLPGRGFGFGSLHPVMQVRDQIADFFSKLGFVIESGPEIEDDWHNFTALNMPENHPARDMQDTFYFSKGTLLRTHTSPVQIRYMQNNIPPMRVISHGRVYRTDFDATHTPMFHQTEGFLIDHSVSFADLKGILSSFLQDFFDKKLKIRFRPSYFPFTEPSAEVDITCVLCDGEGCRVCSETGWLEVLGCGMIHPNVLQSGNIDSEKYMGFAFGLGIDRLTMLYYGIDDLRLLFENDIRFLQQF